MAFFDVNYTAIVVAAIASTVIGMIWYSPAAFGSAWMKHSGVTPAKVKKAKQSGMAASYAAMFVATVITAYVLAVLTGFIGAATPAQGAMVGALAWLGFAATTMLSSVLWEGKPVALYTINSGFSLVSYVVMGIVLVIL